MRTAPLAARSSAGVFAAIGTAVAGALFALFTGLGQGVGNAQENATTVSQGTVVTSHAPAAGK